MPENSDLARIGRTGLLVCAIVACVSGLLLAEASAGLLLLLDSAVGATFILAGLILWRRQRAERIGTLMVATALGWGLGGVLHRGPLAHLLLTSPSGTSSRWTRPFILAAYVDALIGSFTLVDTATLVFGLGLALAAAGRTLGARPALRRGTLPATTAALAIAFVLALGLALRLDDARATDPALVLYELLLIATAIGLPTSRFWGRASAGGLVGELGIASDTPLRERLAHALGDPSLAIGYVARDPRDYVDEVGRSVELVDRPDRAVTRIDDNGQPLAILVHDQAVLDDPRALEEITAVTRIAVSNLRLREEIGARTLALEDSQRRLMGAVDVERRQIERQLAARVLTRLDRVREALGVGPAGRPRSTLSAEVPALLDKIEDDLRTFALGLFPARVEEHGLQAALDELANAASIPVELSVTTGRLPAPIEATAYYVCAEALTNVTKHARASRAEIEIRMAEERMLRIVVSDDGVGGADASGTGLEGLRARVEGLGGRLEITSLPGHGTRVDARLPIARGAGPPTRRLAPREPPAPELG